MQIENKTMLKDHPLITKEEARLIAFIQKTLIEGLKISKKYLSEEEIAYCLRVAIEQESLRLVIRHL
jgi:hypothetical protein